MNDILINALIDRRQAAGSNGKPLSYKEFAKLISDQMNGPTLFRFIKGDMNLQVAQLRLIAAWARANRDNEMLRALAAYALGQDVLVAIVDN